MYYACFQMIMIGTLWRGWSQSTTSLLIHWVCPYHWWLLCLVHKLYLGSIFWRGKFDLLKICTCGKRIHRIDLTEGFHTNPFVGFINNVLEVNQWTRIFILPIFMVFWSDRCKSGDWQRAWYHMISQICIPKYKCGSVNMKNGLSIYQIIIIL